MTFEPGTQIAYIPMHANGSIAHPDVEFGFVTSDPGGDTVFCRYWAKTRAGESRRLRTAANSERTPRVCLQRFELVPLAIVDALLREIYNT